MSAAHDIGPMPAGDTAAAVAFLKKWPWPYPTLSASWQKVGEKKGRFETKAFPPPKGSREVNWRAVHNWIEERQGRANIYFAVNPTVEPKDVKAERTDIRSVIAFHIDSDARVGETQAAARERISKEMLAYEPPPSVVTFSGGGCQAFWFIQSPIPINTGKDLSKHDDRVEVLAKADDAKRHNTTLLRALAGDDGTDNIDRVMRLVGSVNLPDLKKVKKGRVPMLAEEIYFNGREIPADAIPKAPPQAANDDAPSGKRAKSKGRPQTFNTENIARLDYAAVMNHPNIPPPARVLIINGTNPDQKYTSTSEPLFAVCTIMIRAKADDALIYSIITDPQWPISAHILKQHRWKDYALKQIANAHATVLLDPEGAAQGEAGDAVAKMNAKHFVIKSMGGKSRIGSYEKRGGRERLVFSTRDDLSLAYENKTVWLGEERKQLAYVWLSSPARREYEGLTFDATAGDVVEGNMLNLWRGFGPEPVAGDPEPFLNHMRHIICGDNDTYYEYLLNLHAWKVQNPGKPTEVAVVLKGPKGAGKGFFFKTSGGLFGQHYRTVSNPKHFTGNFNAHLRDCVYLFVDEALLTGHKEQEGIINTYITESTIQIEPKGVDLDESENHLMVGIATNKNWAVPMSHDERRYFVLAVSEEVSKSSCPTSEAKAKADAYWKKMHRWLADKGPSALLHYLQHRDIGDFHPRNVPNTAEGAEQKALSRGEGIEPLIEKICHDGRLPYPDAEHADVSLTSGREHGEGLYYYIDKNHSDLAHRAPLTINNLFKKHWGCQPFGSRLRSGLRFPPLARLRQMFEAKHNGGAPMTWDRADVTKWGKEDPGAKRGTDTGGTDEMPF